MIISAIPFQTFAYGQPKYFKIIGRLDALLCSSTLAELRTCGICIGFSIL